MVGRLKEDHGDCRNQLEWCNVVKRCGSLLFLAGIVSKLTLLE